MTDEAKSVPATARDAERDDARLIRRIVLGLEPAAEARSLITAAEGLAARMQAEIEGLVVGGESLIEFADLPIAREVAALTGETRDLSPQALTAVLRRQMAAMRRDIEAAAARAKVAWRLERVSGELEQALGKAAGAHDLVVLGCREVAMGRAVGRSAWAMALKAGANVLVVQPRPAPVRRPAGAADRVLVLDEAMSETDRLSAAWIAQRLAADAVVAEPAPHTLEQAVQAVRRARPAFVIAAAQNELVKDERLFDRFVRRLPCPILVVHGERE